MRSLTLIFLLDDAAGRRDACAPSVCTAMQLRGSYGLLSVAAPRMVAYHLAVPGDLAVFSYLRQRNKANKFVMSHGCNVDLVSCRATQL